MRVLRRWLSVTVLLAACGREPEQVVGPSEPPPVLPPPAPSVKFITPIRSAPNRTAFWGAYYDQLEGGGVRDYECGRKSYDRHQGTDVLIRNFQVMDSGVVVVAAAAGEVAFVRDGEFDRSASLGSGGFGNHVLIRHTSSLSTIYAHLRKNSITVSVGQQVDSGQVLGLVGSSGNSNWPHLHFEMSLDATPVDPYQGACHGEPSMWLAQMAYQDSIMITDGGTTTQDPLPLADLLERPAQVDTFTTAHPSLTFWLQLFNTPPTAIRFDLHDPQGNLFTSTERNFGGTFSMWYVTLRVAVAGVLNDEGRWEIRYFQGSELWWTQRFVLVAAPATAARPRLPRGPVLQVAIWDVKPGDGRRTAR